MVPLSAPRPSSSVSASLEGQADDVLGSACSVMRWALRRGIGGEGTPPARTGGVGNSREAD